MSRQSLITLLVFLHVLGAVVALGFSLSYGLWIARGDAAGGERRLFALTTISWIDRRLTTPAYVLQLITGLLLVWAIGWDLLQRAWLELSLGIYALLTAMAITAYAPAHRRQTELARRLAAGDDVEAEYAAARQKAVRWGVLVTILTLVILALMVWKPALWN